MTIAEGICGLDNIQIQLFGTPLDAGYLGTLTLKELEHFKETLYKRVNDSSLASMCYQIVMYIGRIPDGYSANGQKFYINDDYATKIERSFYSGECIKVYYAGKLVLHYQENRGILADQMFIKAFVPGVWVTDILSIYKEVIVKLNTEDDNKRQAVIQSLI
jgi:hypothetical protein